MLRALAVLALITPVVPSSHRQIPSFVPMTAEGRVGQHEHPDLVKLRRQMIAHPNLPPIDFWFAVSTCETNREWDRGKQWSHRARAYVRGGLGIAWRTTWPGYGGLEFAKTPAHASMYAQIIVANRIGFLGWQTNEYLTWADREAGRKFYRPAAGFKQGWGGTCRKAWVREHGLP